MNTETNNTTASTPRKIVILKNDFDEYQVPDHGDCYFTDDRDDALSTACHMYGADVSISVRRVRA